QAIRQKWRNLPRLIAWEAKQFSHGRNIRIAGLSIVMQRPPTAGGTVFATLEDESGFLDLVIHKKTFEKYRDLVLDHCFLIVCGRIQRDGLSVSLIVQSL